MMRVVFAVGKRRPYKKLTVTITKPKPETGRELKH